MIWPLISSYVEAFNVTRMIPFRPLGLSILSIVMMNSLWTGKITGKGRIVYLQQKKVMKGHNVQPWDAGSHHLE